MNAHAPKAAAPASPNGELTERCESIKASDGLRPRSLARKGVPVQPVSAPPANAPGVWFILRERERENTEERTHTYIHTY